MILTLNQCTFLEGVTPYTDAQLPGTFAAGVCNKGLNQSTFLEGVTPWSSVLRNMSNSKTPSIPMFQETCQMVNSKNIWKYQ
jgi:hypothetical protein